MILINLNIFQNNVFEYILKTEYYIFDRSSQEILLIEIWFKYIF